ncbi:dihydroorotate oxidase [Lentilactobacillus kribbianus]|uniref:dihydroorotate oxidase n=1 Tax=Lentilactobacillus kribbianus TaxID=2729622 RepID=UPI00155517CF|nr:dihydroorotate oxidase [Lentilactobacillus kribbianus]
MSPKLNLQTTIAGIDFRNPILNAAGVWCQSTAELDTLLTSSAGGAVTKSATVKSRLGNATPRLKSLPLGSINSMGLPNYGFQYYLDYVTKQQATDQHNLILSIAGLSVADNLTMLRQIQSSDYTGLVELNLSCPNVAGKSQVGYDFAAVADLLATIFTFFDGKLGLKLPPYFDLHQFDELSAILNQYPLAYINAINSIGNGLIVDPLTESVVIKPKGGFGGIGGNYVKPTALANVRAFRLRLNPTIKIIGTGGISSGQDVFEHILCGADLVQIGTALGTEGPAIFERVTNELSDLMAAKGYQNLADFRGKLKTL